MSPCGGSPPDCPRVPQVTMRCPSSSMRSTSLTAPLSSLSPPTPMMPDASLSPACRYWGHPCDTLEHPWAHRCPLGLQVTPGPFWTPTALLGPPLGATFGSPVAPLDPLGPPLPPSCHSWGCLSLLHVTPRPPLCPSMPALGPSLVPTSCPLCHIAPLCHPWDHCVSPLSPLGSPGATFLSHMSPLAPSLVPSLCPLR